MKLEFLFLDSNNKEEILNYTYTPDIKTRNGIKIQLIKFPTEFKGTDKWTVRLSLNGENKTVAKHLSTVNDEFQKYNPIILANESAEYFNKALYPLANEFERKLRKFLYLKLTLSNDEFDTKLIGKSNKLIKKIEGMTLNEIYQQLFTDPDLIKNIQQAINDIKAPKKYYQDLLSKTPEVVLWDRIIGSNGDFIKDNFINITHYRNDVMHAHNINYSDFLLHRKTLKKAIKIIDDEIKNVIAYPESVEYLETIIDIIDNDESASNTEIQKIFYLLYSSGFFDDEDVKKYLKYNANYGLEGSPKYEQYPL